MTAMACLCLADFIVARGFSTEMHSLTSNFSSVGEIIHAKEKSDLKTTRAEKGPQLERGGDSESDPFYGRQAGKLLK